MGEYRMKTAYYDIPDEITRIADLYATETGKIIYTMIDSQGKPWPEGWEPTPEYALSEALGWMINVALEANIALAKIMGRSSDPANA